MKKNILIISYAYPPLNDAGAQRPFAVAKHLNKEKYNITVITCKNPNAVLGVNENFNDSLENVNLIRVHSYVGGGVNNFKNSQTKGINFFGKIKRGIFKVGQWIMFPDKGMFWYPNVIKFLKKNNELISNTDYIFSTSPGVTNHRIALYVKKKNKNVKWIADFRDFNYVENWHKKIGIKSFLHKKLEKAIINQSSKLTFVTKTMQDAYQKFYPQFKDKMFSVYNGFDKEDFPNTSQNISEKLSFFYAGSFYNGLRSPLPFLQLLDKAFEENLLNPKDIILQIAGKVDEDMKLNMKSYKSYYCIEFLGNLPRTEVLKYMGKTTFLWLIVGNIKAHYQTIPIKLFEYIAARRPILNFAPKESEPSKIIEEKKLGCNINTLNYSFDENYAKFKNLLLEYKNGLYKDYMPIENLNSFSWKNQINIVEKLLV